MRESRGISQKGKESNKSARETDKNCDARVFVRDFDGTKAKGERTLMYTVFLYFGRMWLCHFFYVWGRHCYVTVHLAEHDRYFTSYTRITNRKYMRDTNSATTENGETLRRRRATERMRKEMRADLERKEREKLSRRSAWERNDKHVRYAESGWWHC